MWKPICCRWISPLGTFRWCAWAKVNCARVQNGNPLYARSLLEAPQAREGIVRVYVGDAFAGMGEFQEDGSVRFRAMLLEKRL